MNLLLAGIKLPKEVALPLAILGAIFIGLLLVFVVLQKLGKRGTAILGAVVFALLGFWLINGARLSSARDEYNRIGTERAARVRTALAGLSGAATFQDACKAAGPWKIDQLAIAYEYGKELRSVRLSPSGDSVYGSDDLVYPSPGRGFLNEALNLGVFPTAWNQVIASRRDYPLVLADVAVVANGKRAAVMELETGKVLCSGTLRRDFVGNYYGGFNQNATGLFVALEPICSRLSDDFCGRIARFRVY